MNHRELILSADKKARFHFLRLPEDLQDEIVDGLDSGALTLEAASALCKQRNCPLSHEAIAGYYRAVRHERRLFELNSEVKGLIEKFADEPTEDALRSLVNLVISTALVGIAEGEVGIKDIDLSKLLKAVGSDKPEKESGKETTARSPGEIVKKVQDIYGL